MTGFAHPVVTATRGTIPAPISLCKLFTIRCFHFSSDPTGQRCAESLKVPYPQSLLILKLRWNIRFLVAQFHWFTIRITLSFFVLVFLSHSFRIPLPICTITSLHYPFEHRYFLRFVYDSSRQTLFIQPFGPPNAIFLSFENTESVNVDDRSQQCPVQEEVRG